MQMTVVPLFILVVLTASPAVAQATKPAEAPIKLGEHVGAVKLNSTGPFVSLPNGGLLTIRGDSCMTSHDNGATWQATRMFGDRNLLARPEQGLVRMKDGTIVLVFTDDKSRSWKWDKVKKTADNATLFTWSARSTDNGKTWTDIQQVRAGYCGAIRHVIETSDGKLVVPVQTFLPEQGRHATIPYYSVDSGKSWTATRVLDVGGRGHHDGAIEATLVELKDQRLWMLLRTNLDYFYESFSADGGVTWTDPAKTTIAASSSPAMIRRLASGRLVLLWNRLGPDGSTKVDRKPGGDGSEAAASWFRAELSAALSDDDGKTWSTPRVIASRPKTWLSYPHLLERSPGELWITTMQGGLQATVRETDLLK